MGLEVIGISDYRISKNPEDILITYSLGSCIGLTVYDPAARIGGLIHYMLPFSKVSPDKAKKKPAMFADTGIPTLFKAVFSMGASRNNLIIKVAGGSQLMDQNKIFNIGERNFLVLRKMLWKSNILIKAKHVGGSLSRTLRLEIGTGQVTVKSSQGVVEL